MYMIIVGAGSIGASLIDIAVCEKNNVVVIDSNGDRARSIQERHDITVLNANATSAETLREAGADRADSLIVATSDDAVNLMVVSIGADLGVRSIVSIVNDKEHADFFRKLGANVMENPEDIVANHLYNVVKRPNVMDFTLLPEGAQVFRLEVGAESPLVDRSIAESRQRETIPATMRVIAIARDGEQSLPEDDAVIQEQDVLTVFSLDRVSDDLIEKLSG
ncbi:MAG: TrkA family potassium uptake protein [Candidatus Bipolaricaulia bacterium]